MRFYIQGLILQSLANTRYGWQQMLRTKTKHKKATARILRGITLPKLPLVVTITRYGPRKLDDDNLDSACKYVRDEVARAIGTDDGSPLYTWRCEQERGEYGVVIEIMERGDNEYLA